MTGFVELQLGRC